MFVGCGMQHAMRVRHIGNCGLSDSTVFLPVIHDTNFGKKKVFEHRMCFDFLHDSA